MAAIRTATIAAKISLGGCSISSLAAFEKNAL